jgi:tetratricopeptide (TPR) repeat protein
VAEAHHCRLAVLRRNLAGAVRGLTPSRGGVSAMVATGRTLEAARHAVTLSRELIASHRVRSALEVLEPVLARVRETDRGRDLAEAYLSFARCLRTIRPTDPASARSLARARQLSEDDPELLGRVDLAQARLYKVIGHYGNFRKYLKQAWDRTRDDQPALRGPVATELARSCRWHGDVPRAEHWVEQALAAAESTGDSSLLGEAILQSAACMLARGHVADAEQAFGLAMQEFERGPDRAGFWRALARWASTLRLQGRYSEALSQLYQRLPEASQSQDSTPYVELLQATAWVELDLSRLGRAQECTDELAATVHRGEHLHLRLETQLLIGRTQLLSGQYRAAAYVFQEVHRGARSAELPVLAEHARACLAETMFALGDREASASMFQSAILGLLGSGDVTVLADGIRGRARTQANDKDPAEIFKPVTRLLDEEPMALLRLEHLLARGAWHRAHGDKDLARHAFREAAVVLNRVATGLNDTDRAALRVHPWSAWIRKGLL